MWSGWFQRHHVTKQGRVMLEFLFSVRAALRVFVCSRSDTALAGERVQVELPVSQRRRANRLRHLTPSDPEWRRR